MQRNKPRPTAASLTLELASHAAMGIALGLGFCFALLLIEPAAIGALISHTDQPRTTAVMLVGFFALLFGVGATMTGIIFTTMDRTDHSDGSN
jgi:uncharacterized membrane protein YedE/YeeE